MRAEVPIRRRLVLYAAGVATLGMTLFAALIIGLASRGVVEDQDAALSKLAADTVAAVERVAPAPLSPVSPLVLADLAASTEPFVLVLAGDGTVLYATAVLDGVPPRIPAAVIVETTEIGASAATIRPRTDLEFRVQGRRWQRADAAGIVVAGQATSFTEQQVAGLRFFLVFAGLVTIVAVVLVSRIVVGRALRPLKTLAGTADQIGRTGDRWQRLPPVRTRDEVGLLTMSFNGMLDRLAAAQERLEEALAAQRRFVADASHELRTPLTTIRSNAEFLREHPDAEVSDRVEAVADIAAESERMSRLADDLLLLARAEADEGAARRPVNLAALVAEVGRKATRGGRAVRVVADKACVVEGDADALTRLVWILVDNAMRHGEGEIEILASSAGGSVVLTVTDDGPGIPDGEEERIFERFYRTDQARSGEGAGLGLAIARSISGHHGGSITAANRPGGGAALRVELPLASR